MSSARHGVQAVAPVARVGFRERVEQLQGGDVADFVGDETQRRRVAEVAACRDLGEDEVLADELDEGRDVGGRETHAGRDGLHERDASGGVVPGVALAEVVEERADEQQVGAFDPSSEGLRARRGLHQVPIHGELVERVALRAAAHGRPFGDQTGHEVVLIEGLKDADRRGARPEEGHERLPGLGGPRRVEHRGLIREVALGGARDRRGGMRGRGGDAGERRGLGRQVRVDEDDVAVAQDQPVAERYRLTGGGAPTGAGDP
jgi:hypothetical protein